MNGVAAIELEQWAERNVSRSDFPRLLCYLICGTCRGVQRLEIPGGEHIFLSGLDGLVVCEKGNAFVPDGASAWELSTEVNVTTKANSDYQKRTEHRGTVDKPNTTFLFATPRRWATAGTWEEKKQKERIWKHVRGLSSCSLAAWIDSAPWLADAIRALLYGGATFQIKTARIVWDHYVASPGVVAFDAQFILHDRNGQKAELLRWLATKGSGGDRIVRVSAPSEIEAQHFIAACIHSLGTPRSLGLGSRVLFIESADAVYLLRNIDEEHVVVIEGSLFPNVQSFVTRGNCRIILVHRVPSGDFQPLPTIPSIEIPPMSKDHILGHLVRQGHSDAEAAAACRQCGFDYAHIRRELFLC